MKQQSLSEDMLRELCLILSIGCDRETACRFVGYCPTALRADMRRDQLLDVRVRRAEATAELTYMRNVYEAAKHEKNWRASAWWLERRAPHRYGGRPAAPVTHAELMGFVDGIATAISQEVSADDLARLLQRLELLKADGRPRDEGAATDHAPEPTPRTTYDEGDSSRNGVWRGEEH